MFAGSMPVTAPVPVTMANIMAMPIAPMHMAVANPAAMAIVMMVMMMAMAPMAVTVVHLRDQAAVGSSLADGALRSERRRGRGGEKSCNGNNGCS